MNGLPVEDGGVLIGTVGDLTVELVGGLPVGAVFGVLFDDGMEEIVAPTVLEPVLSGPALSGFLSSCDSKLPSRLSSSRLSFILSSSSPSFKVLANEVTSWFTDEPVVVGCGGGSTRDAHCDSTKVPLKTLYLFCPPTFPGKKYLATTNKHVFCFCTPVATPKPTFVVPFQTSWVKWSAMPSFDLCLVKS